MNEYEAIRYNNIKNNEQFLNQLGLITNSKKSLINNVSIKRNKNEKLFDSQINQLKPIRSSKRLKGESIDVTTHDTVEGEINNKSIKILRELDNEVDIEVDTLENELKQKISMNDLREFIILTNENHAEIISDQDIAHCITRLSTMSNKALALRVKRIYGGNGKHSFVKLLTFYYGLKLSNLIQLAESVKSILDSNYNFD